MDIEGARIFERRCRRTFGATRALLDIGVFCCVLAWLAVLIDVETVMVSGPVLVLLGVVKILFAWRGRYPGAAWIGAAHIGISLLFVGLVNTLDWSPSDARAPFRLMGACYVAVVGPLSWRIRSRLPRPVTPGVCEACGYLLYGLTEPRCPECGRPFDPKYLDQLSPPSP